MKSKILRPKTPCESGGIPHIATFNNFVQSAADAVPELSGLGSNWKAIGSTSSVHARDNTDTNPTVSTGFPIFLLDNTMLAADNADLWDGTIGVPFNVTELGTEPIAQAATGTHANGRRHLANLSASTRIVGAPSLVTSSWMFFGRASRRPQYSMYAISDVLTVSVVPEPTSLALLGLSATGMVLRRRRTGN